MSLLAVSEELVDLLKGANVDFFTTHPCAKIRHVYNLVHSSFRSVGVTKEEEGVGICAGAALAGANPAMLIQSTGLGNMINALCSLTITYQLPLLILASWRGVHQEKIQAQIPLGVRLPKILEAMNLDYHIVESRKQLALIGHVAKEVYKQNSIQVILLHPLLWEGDTFPSSQLHTKPNQSAPPEVQEKIKPRERKLTRYEVLQTAASFLEGKLVICNIGLPSRELYQIRHQSSNFYATGSLGLASSIGLGTALFTQREVVVIDGDGSLLSNLGTLATIACEKPKNLTILAVDNGAHGSTGNQQTAADVCVDLMRTASGLGIRNVHQASERAELANILQNIGDGPNFVHMVARPGNADVPILPLTPAQIRQSFTSSFV